MQYQKIISMAAAFGRGLLCALIACAMPGLAFADCIDDAAAFQHVNVSLMRAIAQVESGTQTRVINTNSNGTVDIGLMQINSSWLPRLAQEGITEQSLFDPCTNAYVGAWILAENIRQFGPTWNAIGAYNSPSADKRLAYARKVYAAAQSLSSSPDSSMPILPPSYIPPQDYNPFASLEVNQPHAGAAPRVPTALMAKPGSSAIASAPPGAYNFGWAVSGADGAKPVQVFDDGAKIYVQFSDMKRVPAIFADTPRGRVVLRWEAQPPYAVIVSSEQRLIFQIGGAEATAQRTGTPPPLPTQSAANGAAANGASSAAPSPAPQAGARNAADKSADALWYATMSHPIPASSKVAAQVEPVAVTAPSNPAPSNSAPAPAPASKPAASHPGTSALWYVTK
ncbi:lytic transglycosylase domain-containing protein [Paraburkholderia tropica]|uniref:lytic transglycosylase domain-containing protein n=1 Tax=Paraburkholderia tropica TaxID=92647 RepID=UPI002AB2123F|nr:transglycosylase SLT domain-containing protein [Paraburkholderia tropica]